MAATASPFVTMLGGRFLIETDSFWYLLSSHLCQGGLALAGPRTAEFAMIGPGRGSKAAAFSRKPRGPNMTSY